MKTDAELQKDVTEQLKFEPRVNASEIGVAVKDGIVTLTGYVEVLTRSGMPSRRSKRLPASGDC